MPEYAPRACLGACLESRRGIGELVGHDDLVTTARTYTHVIPNERELNSRSSCFITVAPLDRPLREEDDPPMDARWMPILAAGLGVLGGIAGAFIGGYVANEGQERRFESERAAANQDLRREAYVTYLGTAQEVIATELAESVKAEPSQAAINAVAVRLYVAEARVVLVAEKDAVTDAAAALREALIIGPSDVSKTHAELQEEYDQAADNFLAVTRDELEGSGE
jgi:hypothetical protein